MATSLLSPPEGGEDKGTGNKARRFSRGATRLGFADVVTTLILLALLAYAAYRQFPTYRHPQTPPSAPSNASAPSPAASSSQ